MEFCFYSIQQFSLFFPLSDYLCTRFLTITIPAASAASAATPIPTPATRGRLFFTFLLPSRSLLLFGTSSSSRSFRSWSAFGVSSSPMVVVSSLPCASWVVPSFSVPLHLIICHIARSAIAGSTCGICALCITVSGGCACCVTAIGIGSCATGCTCSSTGSCATGCSRCTSRYGNCLLGGVGDGLSRCCHGYSLIWQVIKGKYVLCCIGR